MESRTIHFQYEDAPYFAYVEVYSHRGPYGTDIDGNRGLDFFFIDQIDIINVFHQNKEEDILESIPEKMRDLIYNTVEEMY